MDREQESFLTSPNLSCEEVEELLDCYIDSEMILPLKVRFEAHLSQCEHCAELVSDCKDIVNVAKTLNDDPLPEDICLSLRETIRNLHLQK
jgi:anti-sigma factor RsiW